MGRVCGIPPEFCELVLKITEQARDSDGYLINLNDWCSELAEAIAREHQINLAEAHWELIALIREFYIRFEISPAMRPLLKFASNELGAHKATSIYFLTLFPGSPAKLLAKIAGLPKPENCL